MQFDFKYMGESKVKSGQSSSQMNFVPDTLRDPTYFRGTLVDPVKFREAISALNAVVVSDLRMKKKDRTEYLAWAQQQELGQLQEAQATSEALKVQMEQTQAEYQALAEKIKTRSLPFFRARQKYFDYLYKNDRRLWIILDPVISVHPDELFFECFSKDESTYGRLACDYAQFRDVGSFACGTTNIDYSTALYNEFQKLRSYRKSEFQIDPGGFTVETEKSDAFTEVKIDLPDSWVRGFLQVSSAMTLPATNFELHPMDLANICTFLRRNKEKHGPRSIRFILENQAPIKLLFEPWNHVITCHRSIYEGEPNEVRFWGRRRLLVLERLIPWAQSIRVNLMGTGLPSFFNVDLGGLVFTLGCSGWTANDWSRCGQFNLLSSRIEVDAQTRRKIFTAFKKEWFGTHQNLAQKLELDPALVSSALQAYTQAGRVMFDINKNVYRVRELAKSPINMDLIRFSSEQERKATDLLNDKRVEIQSTDAPQQGVVKIRGTVQDKKTYQVSALINEDLALTTATCECPFYVHNKLYKGPCEHILGLRMKFQEMGQ